MERYLANKKVNASSQRPLPTKNLTSNSRRGILFSEGGMGYDGRDRSTYKESLSGGVHFESDSDFHPRSSNGRLKSNFCSGGGEKREDLCNT